ncbi:MAG: hypothetical protein AAF251_12200 [Pseudomonadota bacterium]
MKTAWATVFSIIVLCVVAVVAATPAPACADSWPPATSWSEVSPCGAYRFTAHPPPLDDFYPKNEGDRPEGVLERQLGKEGWQEVWRKPLVNEIGPLSAIVSDDGRYVVTFDNWYSTGYGENVIAIYNENGSLVRSMPLTALIPDDYIETLETSTSSVRWELDKGFVDERAEAWIDVSFPVCCWPPKEPPRSLRFTLDLTDGSISRPSPSQWDLAMQEAEEVRALLYPNAVE